MSPSDLHNPHDMLFKKMFGQREIAADYLRHYLPSPVVAHLRLDELDVQPDSFIDEELREHYSDLLLRAPLVYPEEAQTAGQEAAHQEALVYILFEHKSYNDRLTPFQLLRYMVRIWEHSLRRNKDAPLPPILPIVFYHGRTRWRGGTNFDALYVGPEALRDYWPRFAVAVTDLTQYTDEELTGRVLLKVTARLMKHIYNPRMLHELRHIFRMMADLAQEETELEYLETFLRYVMMAGPDMAEAELREIVVEAFAERGGALMGTIAEKLIEQGLEQGIEQGIQRGRQEGEQIALRGSILKVLQIRFTISKAETERLARRLAEVTDLTRLEAFHEQALRAESLAEFKARLVHSRDA